MKLNVIKMLMSCLFVVISCSSEPSAVEKIHLALDAGHVNGLLETLRDNKGADALYDAASTKLFEIAQEPQGADKISQLSKSAVGCLWQGNPKNDDAFLIILAEAIYKKANSRDPSLEVFSLDVVDGVMKYLRYKLGTSKLAQDQEKPIHAESFMKSIPFDQIKALRVRW